MHRAESRIYRRQRARAGRFRLCVDKFYFHGVLAEGTGTKWSRPPRLGGKQKMGVFAAQPPPPQPSRTITLKTQPHRNRQTRPPLLQRRRAATRRHADCGHQALYPLSNQTRCRIWFRQRQTRKVGSRLAGKHRRGKFICKHQKTLSAKALPQIRAPPIQNIPERIYVMNIADYEIRFQIEENRATLLIFPQPRFKSGKNPVCRSS